MATTGRRQTLLRWDLSMSPETIHHSVAYDLPMRDRSGAALKIQVSELAVDTLEGSIIKCVMTFQVSPEVYQHIDAEALFNLAPEVRGPLAGGAFEADVAIEIEAKLDSAFIFSIAMEIESVDALANYFKDIGQHQPDHELLSSESWLALYVKQQVPLPPDIGEGTLKLGYSTAWANAED